MNFLKLTYTVQVAHDTIHERSESSADKERKLHRTDGQLIVTNNEMICDSATIPRPFSVLAVLEVLCQDPGLPKGAVHGAAMLVKSTSAKIVYQAFWDPFETICVQVQVGNLTVEVKDSRVELQRSGEYLDEAYFDISLTPIRNEDGEFLGILNEAVESTIQVVSQRRLTNLLRTGEATARAVDLDTFWDEVLDAFDFDASEVPFAAVYTRDDSLPLSTARDKQKLKLQSSLHWPSDAAPLPATVDLSKKTNLSQAFVEPLDTPEAVIKHATRLGLLESSSRQANLPTREDSRVLISPIQITSSTDTVWLLLGVKPLRHYDADHDKFTNLLTKQIATDAASLALRAAEKRELLDSVKQARLEQQRSESRFFLFAQNAPVSILDPYLSIY